MMVGVDASAEAVESANRRFGRPGLRFDACSVYDLPYESGELRRRRRARPAAPSRRRAPRRSPASGRWRPRVFLIEPNGYNPTLKLIERFSRYHREHGEKSYAPSLLRRWIRELGGTIEREHYAGLVPFFCPDWMATGLKAVEPAIETTPAVNQLSCAVFTVRDR